MSCLTSSSRPSWRKPTWTARRGSRRCRRPGWRWRRSCRPIPKVSDDEVIEATVMDRRWQLVLDCMGAEEPPFSKGTLVGFRKRLIEHDLDRRLVERTVELAAATKGFGARALRAALDSSPLWGAGRVEDTFNLMGHALRKALGVIAVLQGRGQAAGTAVVAAQAGVPQLAASSLKAALDADWDDPAARDAGPGRGAGPAGPGGGVHRRAGRRGGRGRGGGGRPPGPRPGRGPVRPGAGAAPRGGQGPADQRRRRPDAARPQVPLGAVRRLQAARAARPGHRPGARGGHHPGQRAGGQRHRRHRRRPGRRRAAAWPSCTSTGPTCPRRWSATAARTWPSSARPGGSATPAAGSPRTSSASTSPPGS